MWIDWQTSESVICTHAIKTRTVNKQAIHYSMNLQYHIHVYLYRHYFHAPQIDLWQDLTHQNLIKYHE